MVRGAIWVLCRVWTRPDGWRRRPSQWPAHNVLHHQHVDLWGIYPTKPEVGVYKLQPILQWNLVNFYSSSCMLLSCNLCMFFEFIFVDLQIVIPGCLYQLPNKLEWIDSLSFHWVSHGNHELRDDLRTKTKTASWHQSSWSVRTATPTWGEPRRRKKIACCTQEDWIQHHLEVKEDLVVEGMFSFSF